MERIYLYTEDWQLSLPKKDLQHAQRSSSCEAYVISTTSGYFLSILGPYLADYKNSDAAILNHAIAKSVDTIRVKEEDVMVEVSGLIWSSGGPRNKGPDSLFSRKEISSYPQKMQIPSGWYQK